MKVGIVGASINVDNEQIVKAASDLGEWLSKNNHTIVYSRNAIGLVSVVLNAVEQEGGKSIQLDSISIDDMLSEVDAIIFLPGGIDVFHSGIHLFNLCEEGVFMKPFLLLNIDGFWTPLTHMLTRMKSDQFLANLPDNVCFCDSIESIAKTIKQEIEG